MTDWILETRSGYTKQDGHFKSHELTFTKGCISKLPDGELCVLLDEEDISKLISDLQHVLRLNHITGDNPQYNNISEIAHRFAAIDTIGSDENERTTEKTLPENSPFQ